VNTYTQITIDSETYQKARKPEFRTVEVLGKDSVDVLAVIAWLADLDEMERTAVYNRAGRVARSFYEN